MDQHEAREKRRRRRLRGLWRDFSRTRKNICGGLSRGESLRGQLGDAINALRNVAGIEDFENIVGEGAATSLRNGLEDLSEILQESGDILGNLNRACDIMERLSSDVGPNLPDPGLFERFEELSVVQKTVAVVSAVGATGVIAIVVASAVGGDDGFNGPNGVITRIVPTDTPAQPGPPKSPTSTTSPTEPDRLPDLAVSISEDFTIECDRTVAIICTLTVNVLVENVGDVDLPGPTTVVVGLANNVQFATNLESVPPGRTIQLAATYRDSFYECFKPACAVVVEVDSPGFLAEHSKQNNSASTTLFLADLTVTGIEELPDSTISGVRVRVANVGQGPTRVGTDVTVTIAGVTPATRTLGLIDPGQTLTIEVVTGGFTDCPESGCEYDVRLDAFHRIFESNEANNERQLVGAARIQ